MPRGTRKRLMTTISCGLANIGNTCSINALLQCLAHSRAVRRFFTQQNITIEHTGKFSLTDELVKLLREMWSGTTDVVVPREFIAALYEKCGALLPHGEQHDVCEVYTLLCDRVAEECFQKRALSKYILYAEDIAYWKSVNPCYAAIVSKASNAMKRHNAKNECPWLDMIQGVIVTQIQCECGETSHSFEPFIVLSIEICGSSLYECLDAFFRPERLADWICDKCKRKCATKLVRLWKLPRVLCVSFKRFGANMHKDGRHIDVPEKFGISPDSVIGPQYLNRKTKIVYNLCSVALHHGSIWGGHYTAIGRGNYEGQWIHYDDTTRANVPHPNVTESYMIIYELPR